jgi:multisubunit Na+/H+ antiporter MnhG subunit
MNNELIEQLAKQLNTTVEHLWSVMIRQASVSAYIDMVTIVVLGITLLLAVYGLHKFYSYWSKKEGETDPMDWRSPIHAVGYLICVSAVIAVGVGFVICTFTTIPTIITRLINPEYWALTQILERL